MECSWQVEIDEYATRILAKHWPNVRRWDDVQTFPPGDHEPWRVDVIAGGFPCQDISVAGKGAGLAGERSGLFFEIVRVARLLQPRAIVLENVAALLARGMGSVLGELAAIGFDAEWHCIQAAAIGAPHIRDRVFVVAYSQRDPIREQPGRGSGSNGTGAALAANDGKKQPLANTQRISNPQEVVADFHRDPIREQPGGGSGPNGTNTALAAITRNDWWTTEPPVGRVADGVPFRVDRLRGLGNAIVPQVAEVVGRWVVDVLTETDAEVH
tara:strand:+ start:153 stop:962 length:810 start_codon:yes stop_codon:yes gene_type:complete